jgi:transcriptional regulator with XRE-family HTH domain
MTELRDFFEDLEVKTPREKALADEYERRTRAVVQLARLREKRGVSQTHLAHVLHVAQPTISKLERGGDVRLNTLYKYLEAMGGRLRLTAVFDDEEVDLSLLKQAAESGDLKGHRRTKKGDRAGAGI